MFCSLVNGSRKSKRFIADAMGIHPNNLSWCFKEPTHCSSEAVKKMQEVIDTGLQIDEWIDKNGIMGYQVEPGPASGEISPKEDKVVQSKRKALKQAENGLKIEVIIRINGEEIRL